MYKKKWETKQVLICVFSCIISMLLVFSMCFSLTLAWLSDKIDEIPNTGTTNLATISGGLTTGQNVVELTMPQVGNYINLSTQSTITNGGNLSAVVRVFYSFVIDETTKQIATTNDFSIVNINTDFVASEENLSNVYSGYYFYNKVLSAGESVSFLKTAYPTSTIAGQKVKLNIYCEIVNYEGGPYQLNQELPWNNTPASWFLNHDNLTKPTGNLLSPKIDMRFSDISKIEITAKTSTSTTNGIIGRYGNAYIGLNGSDWVFNAIGGGKASIPASTFCDGDFHVVTFSWNSCTALTDDYICLAWDSNWNKSITFKQIRIWDKSGELVYDLRPNVVTTNYASTSDGKFINKVDNSVLPMYTFSSGVTTSSSSVYEYMGKILYYNNFESMTDGESISSSDGASNSVFSNSATVKTKNGTKGLMVTNSKNISNVNSANYARIVIPCQVKAGYKYNMSLWIKIDAPEGTMSYSVTDGELVGVVPYLWMGEGVYANIYQYGEWNLLSVTTDVIQEDQTIDAFMMIPTGTAHTTYIDDIVVTVV